MAHLEEFMIEEPASGLILHRPGNVIPETGYTEAENVRYRGGAMEPRKGSTEFLGGYVDGVITGFHIVTSAAGTKTPLVGTERDVAFWSGAVSTGTCDTSADGRTVSNISIDLLPSALPSIVDDFMPEDLFRVQYQVSGVDVWTPWIPILWITQDGSGTGEVRLRGIAQGSLVGAPCEFRKTFRFLTQRHTAGTCYIANGSTALTGIGTGWTALKPGDRIMITGVNAPGGTYHRRWYVVKTVNSGTSITLDAVYDGPTILLADATTYVARKCYTSGKAKRWTFATYIAPATGALLFAANETDNAQKWNLDITALMVDAATDGVGGTPIKARYVSSFGAYLGYANIEGSVQNWKQSVFENPEDFVAETSGEYILPEGGDEITGFKRLGNYWEIHKRSGIYYYSEVGGAAPFRLENYVSGVGNVLPYALAGNKDVSIFVGGDNVYFSNGNEVRPINPENNSLWRKFRELLGSGNIGMAHAWYSDYDNMHYIYFPSSSASLIADKALVVSENGAFSFYTHKVSAIGKFPGSDTILWQDMPVGQSWEDTPGTWDDFGVLLDRPPEVQGFGDDALYMAGGNATFTNGSAVVTVANPLQALWLTRLNPGDSIRPVGGDYYTIKSVDGAGQVTLEIAFSAATITTGYEARRHQVSVHYFQRGYSDFGEPYTCLARSKVFIFSDKVMLREVVFTSVPVSSLANLQVRIFRRYDSSDAWDGADSGNLPLTGSNEFKFQTRITGRQFYFEFLSNEINADWVIKRWGFRWVPIGEREGKIDVALAGAPVASGVAPLSGGGGSSGLGGPGILTP
jgi:hypothetical protein